MSVRVHNTRTIRLVGGSSVRALCDVSIRIGRRSARGVVTLCGRDYGDGLEISEWTFSPQLAVVLAPLFARGEDIGQGASNMICDVACRAVA